MNRVATATASHFQQMLAAKPTAVRKDTIKRLRKSVTDATRLIEIMNKEPPEDHGRELAVNVRASAVFREVRGLVLLIGLEDGK